MLAFTLLIKTNRSKINKKGLPNMAALLNKYERLISFPNLDSDLRHL